jgi:hypothetical protein
VRLKHLRLFDADGHAWRRGRAGRHRVLVATALATLCTVHGDAQALNLASTHLPQADGAARPSSTRREQLSPRSRAARSSCPGRTMPSPREATAAWWSSRPARVDHRGFMWISPEPWWREASWSPYCNIRATTSWTHRALARRAGSSGLARSAAPSTRSPTTRGYRRCSPWMPWASSADLREGTPRSRWPAAHGRPPGFVTSACSTSRKTSLRV